MPVPKSYTIEPVPAENYLKARLERSITIEPDLLHPDSKMNLIYSSGIIIGTIHDSQVKSFRSSLHKLLYRTIEKSNEIYSNQNS